MNERNFDLKMLNSNTMNFTNHNHTTEAGKRRRAISLGFIKAQYIDIGYKMYEDIGYTFGYNPAKMELELCHGRSKPQWTKNCFLFENMRRVITQ